MKRIFYLLVICMILVSVTGCGSEPDETIVVTVQTIESAALPETTDQPETTAPAEPVLLTDAPSDKVCVGIMPTETGAWRYVVIEDQEAAIAAFEAAANAVYSDEWWIKGDQTVGMMACYRGEFWDFTLAGELVNSSMGMGRVKTEDAQALYDLCFAAAAEAGWKECVYPADIAGLTSATLTIDTEWNEKYDYIVTQTNPDDLDTLETILSAGSRVALGGTGCPFNAVLTMERELGDTITIRLATDSCGVWMSQGVYYEFASDSQPLFDLFGVQFEAGKLVQ